MSPSFVSLILFRRKNQQKFSELQVITMPRRGRNAHAAIVAANMEVDENADPGNGENGEHAVAGTLNTVI